ncbi:hypothetical protein FKW77_005414 [Venturia effusa]|uniref:Uncharacterized protein n=1 Tax=Venturia effusa TaxID=50376 RepID=A0A517LH66_9PEZI|nr:hypothetical protein FKW77_005414 [Venturia effusa]
MNRLISLAITVIFSLTSLILGFLCIFAGHSNGVLENYAIISLNTSRVGQAFIDQTLKNPTANDGNTTDQPTPSPSPSPSPARLKARQYTITISGTTTATLRALPTATTFSYIIGTKTTSFAYTSPPTLPTPLPDLINALPGAANLASTNNPLYTHLLNPSSPLASALSSNLTQAIINTTTQNGTDAPLFGSLAGIIGISDFYSSFYFGAALSLTLVAVLATKYINRSGAAVNMSVDRGDKFLGLTWSAWVCSLVASVLPNVYALGAWKARRAEKKAVKNGGGEARHMSGAKWKGDVGSSEEEVGQAVRSIKRKPVARSR